MKPEDAVINAIDELVDWQLNDSPAAVAERAAAGRGSWSFSPAPPIINHIDIGNVTITFTNHQTGEMVTRPLTEIG